MRPKTDREKALQLSLKLKEQKLNKELEALIPLMLKYLQQT